MNKSITQDMAYRQSLMKYAEKYGVSCASRKYNKSRSYIYFRKQRWDGSAASLACQSRLPHSHPNQHTEAERKLIRDMRRRNPTLGMIELWHRLRQRGYTRCPESLFRVMRKMGLFPAEKPKNTYKPKPYDYRSKETDNSRNGHSSKKLKTSFGDVEISTPRDRKGEFEPQLLRKNQTSVSQDIEEKILSMYAKGMTTSDIETHIRDIYGVEVSDTTISRITDKILPIVREWQQRPLESIYAVVYMDAIHYHVRSEGQIVRKAVYIAIGIDLEGRKDVLGMWVGENESAKYWATVLSSLRNRGVNDIFIACTDNLTGFSNAINAVFPQTDIQNCIIHQLRNSSKYVSYKDLKQLMADLKAVYAASDEQAALSALDAFEEAWGKKYPRIAASWRENWANLSTYFKFPQEVRRLIYTTNAIEGFNRQLRKVRAKAVFPTDDSLLKMLYLAMRDITKKWTGRRQDWSVIHAQLAIYYADRMPE